jgi:DNA polymerase-3 subunit beta
MTKATVSRSELLDVIKVLTHFTKRNGTLELLSEFFIQMISESSKGPELRLSATDIELSAVISIPGCVYEGENQSFCIDARLFRKIIMVSNGTLILDYDPEKEILKVISGIGELSIKLSKSKYSERETKDSEFFETANEFIYSNLEESVLQPFGPIIQKAWNVQKFASKDDARPILQGIKIDQDSICGCDGFRIGIVPTTPSGFTGLISKRTLTAVKRYAGPDVKFFYRKECNRIYFVGGNFRMSADLIEGNFPDYKAIEPKSHKIKTEVSLQELIAAVRLVEMISDETTRGIRFNVKDQSIEIENSSEEYGKAKAVIAAKVKINEKNPPEKMPFLIAFNGKYLLDYLETIKEETIFMEFNTNNAPGVFYTVNDQSEVLMKYILMPLHLG